MPSELPGFSMPADPGRDWVLPDYQGRSILNLVESLARLLGAAPQADVMPLRDGLSLDGERPGKIVLLILDGLGDAYLRTRGGGSRLLAARRGSLTSVFPSTTASAVTTFLTGLAPAVHGLNGWVTRDHLGELILPLPMVAEADGRALVGPFHRRRLFPYRTLFQRLAGESVVVTPSWLIDSTYSRRHNRGAKVLGYERLDELDATIAAALSGCGHGALVHAYYPGFDSLAHDAGIGSEALAAKFARIDAMFGRLADSLADSGVAVVVSADHGLIDAPLAELCLLGAHPEIAAMLSQPLWGERRAAWCVLREGARDEFGAALVDVFGERIDVLDAARVGQLGLLGPGHPHRDIEARIGDLLLLPRGAGTLVNEMHLQSLHPMAAVHGGLSATEMEVPLIVLAN